MALDTYEAELDHILVECQGRSEEDARKALESWLQKFTPTYHIKCFYFKKAFDQKDWIGKGATLIGDTTDEIDGEV
jgi:hypothetical protein